MAKMVPGPSAVKQWKGINHKQNTRWQQLSRLKASVFFSFLVVMKHSNLYLGLVLPSGGWQSLIGRENLLSKMGFFTQKSKFFKLHRYKDLTLKMRVKQKSSNAQISYIT